MSEDVVTEPAGTGADAAGGGSTDPVDLIIDKLLSVRGARPGKQVNLSGE